MKPNRPMSVTLLAVGVLTVAILYLTRFSLAFKRWGLLTELESASPPTYLSITGGVWGLAGLVIVVGLWRGMAWAPMTVRLAAMVFSVNFWVERLVLAVDPFPLIHQLWPLGVNVIILALVFLALSRPRARTFFGDLHERTARPEN